MITKRTPEVKTRQWIEELRPGDQILRRPTANAVNSTVQLTIQEVQRGSDGLRRFSFTDGSFWPEGGKFLGYGKRSSAARKTWIGPA